MGHGVYLMHRFSRVCQGNPMLHALCPMHNWFYAFSFYSRIIDTYSIGSFSAKSQTPQGQALAQKPHPMHRLSSTAYSY